MECNEITYNIHIDEQARDKVAEELDVLLKKLEEAKTLAGEVASTLASVISVDTDI